MAKRELTKIQKIILSEIPNFFEWHETAQSQIESLIENILAGNHIISWSHELSEDKDDRDLPF